MNVTTRNTNPQPIDAIAEIQDNDPLNLAEGVIAYCRAQHRAAVRIAANEMNPSAVRTAARSVNADDVYHGTLVERAREIVLRGALYACRRNGQIVTFGANLREPHGFAQLLKRPDTAAAASAVKSH